LESNVSFGLRIGQNCDTPKVDFVINFLKSENLSNFGIWDFFVLIDGYVCVPKIRIF